VKSPVYVSYDFRVSRPFNWDAQCRSQCHNAKRVKGNPLSTVEGKQEPRGKDSLKAQAVGPKAEMQPKNDTERTALSQHAPFVRTAGTL
jgi:hypothetical protein